MRKRCFANVPLTTLKNRGGKFVDKHKCYECSYRYNCVLTSAIEYGIENKDNIADLIKEIKIDYAQEHFFSIINKTTDTLQDDFIKVINREDCKDMKDFLTEIIKQDYQRLKNEIETIEDIVKELDIDLGEE